MRLLIMGPPGAGKGTQAARMAETFGVPAISTGDIFRGDVANGTELGREAQRYVAAGEYVPDEVTNSMVRARLALHDARSGWVLDGYPRTLGQVDVLDDFAATMGQVIAGVVALEVDDDELVGRLSRRAQAEGRIDDTEVVIRRRQEVYRDQTAPLLSAYEARNLLISVDGCGTTDHVHERVVSAVAALASRTAGAGGA